MSITLDNIKLAAAILEYKIAKTPVLTSSTINDSLSASLYFKCDNFQKTGSFKIRGATNAVFNLTNDELKYGIVTHSSGNHAAALVQAAKWRDTKCYIVMPENAPKIKKDTLLRSAVDVYYSDATVESRMYETEKIVRRTGATIIHPYDNDSVIAGAGTAALELIQEVNDLEVLIAPIGGGGLLSGSSIAAKGINPSIQVIGAEPLMADDASESFKKKEMQPQRDPKTIADGLRASLCPRTFKIILENVDDILTVTDEEILKAMFLIWERMKIIVEPSAAVSLAVAIKLKEKLKHKKTGLILSGGNVDFKQVIPLM
jgi:threonine dehydratase